MMEFKELTDVIYKNFGCYLGRLNIEFNLVEQEVVFTAHCVGLKGRQRDMDKTMKIELSDLCGFGPCIITKTCVGASINRYYFTFNVEFLGKAK